jgi:hypothetical protein
MEAARSARLVIDADPGLAGQLRRLSARRMVFFAGLPGTGKSLLAHQLVHLAAGAGQRVHLLQWDVARPVFEACGVGRRYPLVDGVTHAVIRKAAGLWVRRAIARWHAGHPDAEDLLVGETPFVGGRFVELARRLDDGAEALLVAPSCRFAIAVPSAEVRQFLEAERERRAANPLHPREREDAPPHVLRELWRDLAAVARQLGADGAGSEGGRVAGARPPGESARESRGRGTNGPVPYDPAVYARVYATILRQRNAEIVALDKVLPTGRLSVYDFEAAVPDLVPTHPEAEECIHEVERQYPHQPALEREMARWWEV